MSDQEKIIRVIDYLLALTKINTKIIQDLADYRKVLWIYKIPHESKYCYARTWEVEDEHSEDIWIEIKKLPEPHLPKIPDICIDWIDRDSLWNTKELPELKKSILIKQETSDPETGNPTLAEETKSLDEHPELRLAWDDYLEKRWLPWSDLYNRYIAVLDVYKELFYIYQEQQKLGEQYELVYCQGLLTWKTPNGRTVRRHLIYAKASLEFEAHLGKFVVRASTEGDQADIELDMLELNEQPKNLRELSEKVQEKIRGNIWDRASIDMILNSITNSLVAEGQGEYSNLGLEPEDLTANSKPRVEFAPALILRKRSLRGLEQLLIRMKDRIEKGEIVPDEFLDLCENLDNTENKAEESAERHYEPKDSEIYFPLSANDEQRRIIHILDFQKGVVVQGPPGTGKSHTIANLISHLLAFGMRILVTSKSPRALQVLKDKLPDEIKPLCISLLGNSLEERESLEQSVSGILAKLDKRDEIGTIELIDNLEKQLQGFRASKTETEKKLIALREIETYKHIVGDGIYLGTATEIARKIKQEESLFGWFVDKLSIDATMPFSSEEIISFCNDLVELSEEEEQQLMLVIPDSNNELPDIEDMQKLFKKEMEARLIVENKKSLLTSQESHAMRRVGNESIKQLASSLEDIYVEIEAVKKKPSPWIPAALREILSGDEAKWEELHKLSLIHSKNLRPRATGIDNVDFAIPADLDPKKLLNDARVLKAHFAANGSKGFLIFKPKAIRENGSWLKKLRVDGKVCTNTETLQHLIDYLSVEQELKYIWSIWAGKAESCGESFLMQITEIEALINLLQKLLYLSELKKKAEAIIANIKGLNVPDWINTAAIKILEETCEAVLDELHYLSIVDEIEGLEQKIFKMIARGDIHPIINEVAKSFKYREIEQYIKTIERIRALRLRAENVRRKHEITEKIKESAPYLAEFLTKCREPEIWTDRLKKLSKAWAWAKAKNWIEDLLSSDVNSLKRHTNRLEEEIRKAIAVLASDRAWKYCFTRMHETHRRHLMGWQNEMKLLGKGKGKHAHTHRQNALRHLNECREAVPAWIMPLHRVYDTVDAGAGIFDVIIVDEASQCGPEAIPLFYLSKRILIVGDDKQISPEAVGINRDEIQQLMRNYLYDFHHADSFDVENSLFTHAKLRFSNRITLREHFRCMPEIIQFSNDLCYRSDPLIPLRQYPLERLEPLKAVYVKKGYREGLRQDVINRPEAEMLALSVNQCCKDKIYDSMTMGVIVLQGEAQAYQIENLLLKYIGAEEMKKRRIICGNPYSFQGDERDVIFLSMVAAPNERIGPLNQAADQRRFNVAASRAKEQMWLFHSVTVNDLSESCLRRRLLDYFYNPKSVISQALGESAEELREKAFKANRQIEKPPFPFESWFEVDVALDIASHGFRVVPQLLFADKRIDLVVQGPKAQLAVECDGDYWHGIDEYVKDIERQRKLERCGWTFLRIRGSEYYSRRQKVLENLLDVLNKMKIFPVNRNHIIEETDEDTFRDSADHLKDLIEDETTSDESEEVDEKAPDTISEEDSFLANIRTKKNPTTIQEAFNIDSIDLGRIILEILKNRPKYSCVRSKMPTYILKLWGIRTRGIPRRRFARKIDNLIQDLANKDYITIYESVNKRIKLGMSWHEYPGIDFF